MSVAALLAAAMSTGIAHADTGSTASSPTNFYAGAALGSSQPNTSVQTWNGLHHIDSSTTGWSIFAGIRPQKFIGAELAYVDFGNAEAHNLTDGTASITYKASVKNTAIGGYVVGYLPLSSSNWDVYARLGVARLSSESDSNGNYPNVAVCGVSSCPILGMASYSASEHTTSFAYGLGAQYRFGTVFVRGDFQKIMGDHAKPDLVSLGVGWNF
jgi:hypothetical protein